MPNLTSVPPTAPFMFKYLTGTPMNYPLQCYLSVERTHTNQSYIGQEKDVTSTGTMAFQGWPSLIKVIVKNYKHKN